MMMQHHHQMTLTCVMLFEYDKSFQVLENAKKNRTSVSNSSNVSPIFLHHKRHAQNQTSECVLSAWCSCPQVCCKRIGMPQQRVVLTSLPAVTMSVFGHRSLLTDLVNARQSENY